MFLFRNKKRKNTSYTCNKVDASQKHHVDERSQTQRSIYVQLHFNKIHEKTKLMWDNREWLYGYYTSFQYSSKWRPNMYIFYVNYTLIKKYDSS